MSKRKASSQGSTSNKKTVAGLSVPPSPQIHYKDFLDKYIFPKLQNVKNTKNELKNWPSITLATPEEQIIDEIAKKFNTSGNTIDKVAYIRAAGQPNFYEGDTLGKAGGTKMTLAPPARGTAGSGPNPTTVAHELIHANDHQIDQLNPKVWTNLGALATTGGVGGSTMKDFGEFGTSVGRIQDKIDLTGAFKHNPQYPGSGYPIDENYIKTDIEAAGPTQGGLSSYVTPYIGGAGSALDWPQIFANINNVVTHTTPPSSAVPHPLPNPGFFLNRASEFPAFISENLTRSWDAADKKGGAGALPGANALSFPEARFLHSTLGNMDTAYPAADPAGVSAYPVMNQHIKARRNSLEQAYYPPSTTNPTGGPPTGTPFAHGGRVTGKNLLSRFKKTRHKII